MKFNQEQLLLILKVNYERMQQHLNDKDDYDIFLLSGYRSCIEDIEKLIGSTDLSNN